ncbi:MAG: hypothetical protein HY719_16170, partial [Planctomycetes bacterium]|nr:hypothetical protein [Planctomycetota bacterium]
MKITCPECGRQEAGEADAVGATWECEECGAEFEVPAPEEGESDDEDGAPSAGVAARPAASAGAVKREPAAKPKAKGKAGAKPAARASGAGAGGARPAGSAAKPTAGGKAAGAKRGAEAEPARPTAKAAPRAKKGLSPAVLLYGGIGVGAVLVVALLAV